jgi:hypothetical protein
LILRQTNLFCNYRKTVVQKTLFQSISIAHKVQHIATSTREDDHESNK